MYNMCRGIERDGLEKKMNGKTIVSNKEKKKEREKCAMPYHSEDQTVLNRQISHIIKHNYGHKTT